MSNVVAYFVQSLLLIHALIELRSWLGLDKLYNSIIEIMGIAKLEGDWNIHHKRNTSQRVNTE